ncbi:MAG TPA: flagellar M-ring protein FliF, partial [Leptospiraceae bacterium]|nr:flagellar M-ring protein FliF [Leptospiraceae bacterium]
MPEALTKLLNQTKELLGKIDTKQKIILGSVLGVVIIAVILLSTISLQKNSVVLFKDLNAKDFGEVTKKLDSMGYTYSTSDASTVAVDPDKRQEIITKLAQENLIPVGV